MAFSGWMMVYWLEECYEYQKSVVQMVSYDQLVLLKIVAIAGISLAFLNTLVNLVQTKIGYFLMAALELILLVIAVCCVGFLLRDVRRTNLQQIDGNEQCSETMELVHEDNYSSFCVVGGKYLDNGSVCSKAYMTNRWETDNSVRALNPGCCAISSFYFIYPFMLLGFWGLVLICSTAIAIACNIYIADCNEYLTHSNSGIGIIDFIGLALVLLTIIVWGIYFWARKKNFLSKPPNATRSSFIQPQFNPIDGWTIVPDAIIQKANAAEPAPVSTDGCYSWDGSRHPIATFSTTTGGCVDPATCTQRVAILLRGGTIKLAPTGQIDTNPPMGSTNFRGNFFPGCTADSSNYYFFYGTKDQVDSLFKNLRVCPSTKGVDPYLYLYDDQVKTTDLRSDNSGHLTTEPTTVTTLSSADQAGCGNTFADFVSNTQTPCTGVCKQKTNLRDDTKYYTLKGRLFYILNGVNRYDIKSQVRVDAYDSKSKIGTDSTLLDGGIFTIGDIPKYKSTGYVLKLVIKDATGVFQDKTVDLFVSRDDGQESEVQAGNIRLTTKDGNVCVDGQSACLNAQQLKFGQINFLIQNATDVAIGKNPTPAEGVTVSLLKDFSVNGQKTGEVITYKDGTGSFKNIAYGSYMLVATKSGFTSSMAPIDLQEDSTPQKVIVLKPTISNSDMSVVASMTDPSADFDLYVDMNSDTGKSCTVSAVSKYCPYASHVNDVAYKAGEEYVVVKKLAVANYMAYVAPAPTYDEKCAGGLTNENNNKAYHAQAWNWETFKTKRPLESLGIITTTLSGYIKGSKSQSVIEQLSNQLPTPMKVETDEQAKKEKNIININGVIQSIIRKIATKFSPSNTPSRHIPDSFQINGYVVSNVTDQPVTTATGTLEKNTLVYYNNTKDATVKVTRITTKETQKDDVIIRGVNVETETTYTNKSVSLSRAKEFTTEVKKIRTAFVRDDSLNFKRTDNENYEETIHTDKKIKPDTNPNSDISTIDIKGTYKLPSGETATYTENTVKTENYVVATDDTWTTKRSQTSSKDGVNYQEDNTFTTTVVKNADGTKTKTLDGTKVITETLSDKTTKKRTIRFKRRYSVSVTGEEKLGEQSEGVTVLTTLPDGTTNTKTESEFKDFKRILQNDPPAPAAPAVQAANYILISCFNGFGPVTLNSLNSLLETKPTMNSCISQIEALKPNYTLQKLRAVVDEHYKNNPL